ncbi:MAG: ABC transporter ATP-binding protein, partial [Tyzzerella sp.]|nr:ABC transporter ATP-binding protein [Tyzzerella sp.]
MESEDILLDVRHLCQHFKSGVGRKKLVVKAVDDVSFKIPRGKTFGLVGESGCGKTTTGRTIIRLYKATSGEVLFEGKDIAGKLTAEEKREVTRNIQMIFQDPISSLNPRMTIQEIIGEGLIINKVCKTEEEVRQICLKMIRTVGLADDHLTRYPHEFSGGQRQR